MADPVSISASIAGLVSLADMVFGRIYRYVKAVNNAAKDITKLSSQIGALYGVLSSLRLVSDQLEDEAFNSTARVHLIHSCHQTLERLKSILDRDDASPFQDQPFEKIKRKLRWPFTSTEVKDLTKEIEEHKSTLGLALNVDSKLGLLRVLSRQDDLHEDLNDIKNVLHSRSQAETRVHIDKECQKVLESFGSIDPGRNLEMSRKLRHPTTGLWLTDSPEFKAWLASSSTRLWFYGIPGAGKTILASLLIDEILKKSCPSIAAAYFFCDYKDSSTHEAHKILGCLVQQIARQDEQSFAKVKAFYDTHSHDRTNPIEYDAQDLCRLVIELASNYDATMIVVDGLDECGEYASLVTELLARLSSEATTDLKTLFLSRDELDIRDCLQGYDEVSIAARSSDLKLYVDAEIEKRTRLRKLNIKAPGLKEHVRERLVEGADGMFRWVSCQLDYLTELPNDAARRKALKDLPRGLKPTYERLLRRINETNRDTQKLVQRTLKWIAHDQSVSVSPGNSMTAQALCEATSINIGDNSRDAEAIPDQSEILRSCSSLIRMSVDGERFEFAHFTVAEFLKSIDDSSNGEFAAYKIHSDSVLTGLAKVCLTYLNFQDFQQSGSGSIEITKDRFKRYPFRGYVTKYWVYHADVADWEDQQLFLLATELYHPSKRGTFITWMQDRIWDENGMYYQNLELFLAEATTLHIATLDGLSEVCQWLVENDRDVNRNTIFGTPLHCALSAGATGRFRYDSGHDASIFFFTGEDGRCARGGRDWVLHILLEAGADPNMAMKTNHGDFSPLYLALDGGPRGSVRQLLQKGAIPGDVLIKQVLDKLDDKIDDEIDDEIEDETGPLEVRLFPEDNLLQDDDAQYFVQYAIEHARMLDLSEVTRARALRYSLRAQGSNISALLPMKNVSTSDTQISKQENEMSLRTAAEYGQVDVVIRLLDNHHVDVNAVEESTLFTALHYASDRDHLEVAQLLMVRGADPRKADSKGRSALHHSVKMGTRCLEFYLQQNCDTTVTDDEHLTVWHLTALNKNPGALRALLKRSDAKSLPISHRKTSGLSLISCASRGGSIEVISLLLDAGCTVSDLDYRGWTPLHHAANVGSPDIARFLIDRGADTRATTDCGSSMVHCAIMGDSSRLDEVLDILLDFEIDPYKARQDGVTPMELLVSQELNRADELVRTKALRRLSSVPNLSEGKQGSLNQALKFCCQVEPSRRSTWLSSAFQVLLENGADLTSKADDGKSSYRALFDTWQDECLMKDRPATEIMPSRSLAAAAEMVLSAMEYLPPEGFHQDLLNVSSLLKCALAVSNDDLICKLLEFSPDVDKYIDDSYNSPILYACRNGCSSLVLEKLLARSKASSDAAFGSDLVRETCRTESINSNGILLGLLGLGLDCNGPSPKGETALMYAAGAGNVDTVNTLLAHGSDAKARDDKGRTMGHYACRSGRPEILRVLQGHIDWNATVSVKIGGSSRQKVTILHLAATHYEDSMLEFLLNEELIKDIDAVTECNETALCWAVLVNIPRNVSLLVSKNADTDLMDKFGSSPIHVAAELGYVQVVSEFMNHGCNLKLPNREGLNCEMIARTSGHTQLATMIKGHVKGRTTTRDPIITSKTPETRERVPQPLRRAIDLGNLDVCQGIIREGVDLDAGYPDCDGCTALLYCLHRKEPEIAEHIAIRGASPVGKVCGHYNPHGYSVFHLAASSNYSGLLKILLELQSTQYRNLEHPAHPLHLAVESEATECVELMIAFAENEDILASPTSQDCTKNNIHQLVNMRVGAWQTGSGSGDNPPMVSGDTPLIIAAKAKATKATRLLLEAGALVDNASFAYKTPLHIAAWSGDVETMELLLGFRANPHARDCWLRTPAMLAARRGHLKAFLMLSRNDVDHDEVDAKGESILHHAAISGTVEGLLHLMNYLDGDVLGKENKKGDSALSIAFTCVGDKIPMLLNAAPSQGAYCGKKSNALSAAMYNDSITALVMRMVLKRLPREILSTLLAQQNWALGTPLYAACTMAISKSQIAIIDLLLDAGAALELKGGDQGTSLMGACATGRLEVVKHLVREGARICYIEDGQVFSALDAAEHFPDIVRWLLVGRFLEGPKLLTS